MCPEIHLQKGKVGQFTALIYKEYLKFGGFFFFFTFLFNEKTDM